MKLVPESLNEISFERGQSPKAAMGIGLVDKLHKALEKAGYEKTDAEISTNGVIHPSDSYGSGYGGDDGSFHKFLAGYMEPKKAAIAKILLRGKNQPSKSIQEAIKEAYEDGISVESLELLIDHYSESDSTKTAAKIQIAKLTRTKEKEKFEDEYNTYIFIGYTDKVPVEVNGKQYYEDKFVVENMVKIDMYNPGDLQMVSGMKLRTRYQNYPGDSGGTWAVKVPKELMDEDSYHEIPGNMQDIVEKYKFKI